MGKIIVLGDLHFPYHSKHALSHVLEVIKRDAKDISHIVQIGDLLDFFSLSRFPRSHDYTTPLDEVTNGVRYAREMWAYIRRVAPKAQCWQLLGNHDIRLKLRIKEKLPEILNIVDFNHIWKFPGVKTVMDDREEVVIKGIAFMHGFYSNIGQHCRHNMMNTVHGHTHRAGTHFTMVQDKSVWELDAGFLADPRSKVMTYTKQRWGVWTMGYGVIDNYGPRFVPIPFTPKRGSKIIRLIPKAKVR